MSTLFICQNVLSSIQSKYFYLYIFTIFGPDVVQSHLLNVLAMWKRVNQTMHMRMARVLSTMDMLNNRSQTRLDSYEFRLE